MPQHSQGLWGASGVCRGAGRLGFTPESSLLGYLPKKRQFGPGAGPWDHRIKGVSRRERCKGLKVPFILLVANPGITHEHCQESQDMLRGRERREEESRVKGKGEER